MTIGTMQNTPLLRIAAPTGHLNGRASGVQVGRLLRVSSSICLGLLSADVFVLEFVHPVPPYIYLERLDSDALGEVGRHSSKNGFCYVGETRFAARLTSVVGDSRAPDGGPSANIRVTINMNTQLAASSLFTDLKSRIDARQARVGIIGLCYGGFLLDINCVVQKL